MKLIEDWRKAWRWFSVQAMALSSAGLATWAVVPDDLRSALPHWLVPAAASILLIAGIAGRLVDQKPKDKTEETLPGAK